MIFTCCLKRGNYSPFCSPNAFQSNFDNTLRKSSLPEHPFFSAQVSSFTRLKTWAEKPGCSRRLAKKVLSRNSPQSLSAKWSFEAEIVHKKKKIWMVEVVFFLLMNDSNFRIWSHREVGNNVQTVHFSTFFQDRVIWGYLTEKIKPRKTNRLKVLVL